jgi:hypothetical protein
MSVVRGRPPGLAGGISGASRAYCSSLKACPAPKSPTSARLSIVHMVCLQEGLFPPEPPGSSAGTAAHPNEVGFSNGLLARLWPSGGMAERVGNAVAEHGAEFSHLGLSR